MKNDYYVLTYERVSTEDQTYTKSCEDQKTVNDRYIAQQGWQVAGNGDYRDEGFSGKLEDRPGLQDLLIRCEEDKRIKAIVVSEIDRIARGNKVYILIRERLKDIGIKIVAVTQPMLDGTDEGEMMGEILGSVNGYMASISRRKSMRASDEKALRGWYPSKAPYGYRNVNIGTELQPERIIQVNEDEAIYVRKIPAIYNQGKSYREIADHLQALGAKGHENGKISPNQIRNILFNDFYLGIFKFRSKTFQGKHTPLLNKYEVYQARNRSKEIGHIHSTRPLKETFPFKRLPFYCASCECRITAEKKIKRYKRTDRIAEYILYHCTKSKGGWKKCTQPTINKNSLISEFAEKAVAPIEIDKELAEFLFEEMHNEAAFKAVERAKLIENITRRLGQIETELHNLFEMRIAGTIVTMHGRAPEQVYEEFRLKKESERDKLLLSKERLMNESDEWKEKASNFFSLCVDATNRFLKATEEKQVNFLKVISSNVLLDEKKLVVTHQFPFSVLSNYSERTNLLPREDSNLEP